MLFNFLKKEKKINPEHELQQWQNAGRPAPPPHLFKQQTIAAYAKQHSLQILVETGTYLGDMVDAQKNNFEKIYSIELSEKLYSKALKKFKGYNHIHLLHGDSGRVLSTIIAQLSRPALFWLDGHYSGGITAFADKECPVPEELDTIFASGLSHVILIDDARLFNGTNSYPSIENIKGKVEQVGNNMHVSVADDIIRIVPQQP